MAGVIRGQMPAAFHALRTALTGCQDQPQRHMRALGASGFSGQMHSPHLCQPGQAGQIPNHQRNRTGPQGFFQRPQHILGAQRIHKDQPGRIHPSQHALGIQAIAFPIRRNPENRPLHLCGNPKRKAAPGRATALVQAPQRKAQTRVIGDHGNGWGAPQWAAPQERMR